MNLQAALDLIGDLFESVDDLTDEQCQGVDALYALAATPCLPVSELVEAIGADDVDDEGIIAGSAADQCSGVYDLLARYGVKIG
jgi:hypothetical protein